MESFSVLNTSIETSIASTDKINAAIDFLKKVLQDTEEENKFLDELLHEINITVDEFDKSVLQQIFELSELQRKLKISNLSMNSISHGLIPNHLDFKLKRINIELKKHMRILDNKIQKQIEHNNKYDHEIENFHRSKLDFNEEEYQEKLKKLKQYNHMTKSLQEKFISQDPRKCDIMIIQEQINNLQSLRKECAKLKLL